MSMYNLLLQSVRTEKVITYSEVSWCNTKFLYMWEKVSERKQLRYGCPFNLIRDSTTYEQNHLDFVNQHRCHIRKEQILLFQNWLYRNEIYSATEFHWTLTRFDCKNIKCRVGGSYLQEISLPFLFLETLWSRNHGNMTKKNVYCIKYADWWRQSVTARHSPLATLY